MGGTTACDHLGFKRGDWSSGLKEGDRFSSDALVDSYDKGYHGRLAEEGGEERHETNCQLE